MPANAFGTSVPTKQACEDDGDRQIEQDSTDDAVIGDASRRKGRACNHPSHRHAHDQPGAGEQVQVENRRRSDSQNRARRDHGERDQHRDNGQPASRHEEDAAHQEQGEHQFKDLKREDAVRLQGRHDKQHDHEQNGKCRQERIGPAIPQSIDVHAVRLHVHCRWRPQIDISR
jgi:hypothetical protein